MLITEVMQKDPIIKADESWAGFQNKALTDPSHAIANFSQKKFDEIADNMIGAWINSADSSFLHGLSHIGFKPPSVGQPLFPDLIWQTRFLIMAAKMRFINRLDLMSVRDSSGKRIQIADHYAQTEDRPRGVNELMQYVYLYYLMKSAQKVKAPKLLYRGIRAYNLYNDPRILKTVPEVENHLERRKLLIDATIQFIIKNGINSFKDEIGAERNLLSFTASLPIAKYYSNNEGFVLIVESSKVHIVTSELHDDNLAEPNFHNNKREREYAITIPNNYKFTDKNFIINDGSYFKATNSPLSVPLLDHDDMIASYIMNKMSVEAKYHWVTNNKGRVEFKGQGDSWFDTRKQFIELHGFDPMPSEKNLHKFQISNCAHTTNTNDV